MAKRTRKPAKPRNMVETIQAAFPDEEIRLVDVATAEANLRRGNEAHALLSELPRRLALSAESADHVFQTASELNLPPHLEHGIKGCATVLRHYISAVRDHVDRGETAQAALAGIELGIHLERIVRLHFQRDVERENKRKIKQATTPIQQHNDYEVRRAMARELFAKYDKTDRKKSSVYKDIGKEMAQHFGLKSVSERSVRRYLSKIFGHG